MAGKSQKKKNQMTKSRDVFDLLDQRALEARAQAFVYFQNRRPGDTK